MKKNVLKVKKYVATLLLVLVVVSAIGILRIGNFDKLAGKVKVKDVHLSNITTRLSSNVFDASSDNPITSNGFDQINYELKYKVSNADRDVIITGTLRDDERYATFKRVTGDNITSTLSNNDRSIEIVVSNVPANTEITTNVALLINGAPNGYSVNPRFQIKESTSDTFNDIYTNSIEVSTNDLRGVVRNTDGDSISNIIISLYKNRELVKETYTNNNGEYIFSDLNEDSYTVKINEEIYKDVSVVADVSGDTVLDLETERIYPFDLQIHKYITKVDAYNVGNLISRNYSNASTVNFPIEKLQSLSGKVYYKIVVENTGEKEGIVSAVKDELPEFMSFNEEENSGFELVNGYIYDRNLEGITLAPGESREDSLVLNIIDTKEAKTYLNRVNAEGEIYNHVVYLVDNQTYKEEDVLEGELTTRPTDPTPTFEGWYTDSKYTNLYNFNNPVIKNLVLYGKTTQKYRVEFFDKDPETGTETPYDEQEVNGGDPVTKPSPDPTHTGYTFKHWCKTDLTEYVFGTPVNENLKLITCYKINEYDVNFYNYSDTVEKNIKVEYKHLIDQTQAPTFDETGYTFLCWSENKSDCFDFTTPVTKEINLYPTHERLNNAVVFNDENRITTKEVPYGDTVEPVDNQGKTGHTFRCWSEDRENCFDFNTPIIQNTTVYAIYDINKFTVHFIDRDPELGTDTQYGEDQIIDYGSTATRPDPNPSHTGYTFSEWKDGENTYNFETPVTDDITLISNYNINSYPVRFHNDNEVTTVNVQYKNKVTPITSPTKEHHIFTAWLDANDIPFDFDTLIVDETDLYSSFEEVLSPKISHAPTMWTNGNVFVTVSKNDSLEDDTGYSYLYKTTEGTYETYETPVTITENTTIIAKAVKSEVGSEVTSHEIVNIDKLNPTVTTFSENAVNKNSATLNVGVLDNESGINYYEIYQDGVKVGEKHFECYNETTFDEYEICRRDLPTERVNTYTVTGLEQATTYTFRIKAYDKAGNYVLSDELEVTTSTPIIVARLIGYNNQLFEDTVDPATGDVIVPKEDKYINFESLAEAFDYEDIYDCKNVQCTIQMVTSTNESVEVLEGQNLTLDLNGKIVSGINSEYTIKNNGEFTLIESTPETSDPGKLINTQGVALLNKTGASFTLGEGYYDREVISSTVSITRPYIYGETVGVKNEKNGNFTFFDGRVVAPATTISGQGAINGEVTATEFSYTPGSNSETVDERNYQVIYLEKIIDPEARVNKGMYYSKLSSAMNNVNVGSTTIETDEESNLMNDLEPAGNFYFVYDENTGKWISNGRGNWRDISKSKLIIDLREEDNDKILNVNYSVDHPESYSLFGNYGITDDLGNNISVKPVTINVNEYENYGKTLGDSVSPYYYDNTDFNFNLEKGKIYILNIQYFRPNEEFSPMVINNITLLDATKDTSKVGAEENVYTTSYSFYYDETDGTIRSNNQYVGGGPSSAFGYTEIDLTDKEGEYELIVNASMESTNVNSTAYGYIAVTEDNTISNFNSYLSYPNIFFWQSTSNPDVVRESSTSPYYGFSTYGPSIASTTLTGGKKYYLKYKYEKRYVYDDFPTQEEFERAGCADQLIIHSIDLVKKSSESTRIDTDKYNVLESDEIMPDLLLNSGGTFIQDGDTIRTNNTAPNQTSTTHTTIDLTNDEHGKMLLLQYSSTKGSNNTTISLNTYESSNTCSNCFVVLQKRIIDGVEKYIPVYNGGQIRKDGVYTDYVYDLPGGYEYEIYYNVVSPSSTLDTYPNIVISNISIAELDAFEGNYFNGVYPYSDVYEYDHFTIISNNNDYINDQYRDSYVKLDLRNSDKNQLLTLGLNYNNPNYNKYFVYITNNNRALSYNDVISNRGKELMYIGSRGYGNNGGSSSSSNKNYSTVLEKGKVYYLHFAGMTYSNSFSSYGSSSSYGNYSIRLSDIKLTPIEESLMSVGSYNIFTGTLDVSGDREETSTVKKRSSQEPITENNGTVYGFDYNEETGMYDALNSEVGTIAAKVFKIDLSEATSDKMYIFETNGGGYKNYYTVTDSENVPIIELNSYSSESSGNLPNGYQKIEDNPSFTLEAGKVYYVQVVTYKNSANTNNLSLKITQIEGENATNNYNPPKEVREFNEKVDTVQLLKDVSTTDSLNVDYSEEVVFDLNGYDLTSNQPYVINNSGDLTIIDSKYDENSAQYAADLAEYQEYAGLCDGCSPSAEYILDHSLETKFEYTGNEQTFTAPYTGDYEIEVWGAQGGNAKRNNSTSYTGGYGSYSKGTVHLNKNDVLYINIGGSGTTCTNRNCTAAGGYNGGGSSYGFNQCDTNVNLGSGGGATHIATSSGKLYELVDDTNSILIVAGGGGGASYCNSYNYAAGGSGGGATAVAAVNKGARDWTRNGGPDATGGTQLDGNAFGLGYGSITDYSTGAGGGYYGGKGTAYNGSGGGSGYIGNTNLTDKKMVMFTTDESFVSTEESTKTEITSNHSSSAISDYAKEGNGYAVISLSYSEEVEEIRDNLPKTYDVKEEPDDSFKEEISKMSSNSTGLVNNEKNAELTLKNVELNVNSNYGINNEGKVIIDGEPTINVTKLDAIGINNTNNGSIENNGKLNINLNTSNCSTTKDYNTVGISYSSGKHDISNINITGKNGTGILVDSGTEVSVHSSNINLTDLCGTVTFNNSKDYTKLSSYNKSFSYTGKSFSTYVNRRYTYYNRNDGTILNKGTINVDDGTTLVGVISNYGTANLYNGVNFNNIYQFSAYKNRYNTYDNKGSSTVNIYNTVANVDKIVNTGGTINIIEEEGNTSSISSANTPAVLNLGNMNITGGTISSLYNAGTLSSTNTNYSKLYNLHTYTGNGLKNEWIGNYYYSYNYYEPFFSDKKGTANIVGGSITDNQLINENEMTLDGVTVPNGIINRGDLTVKGDTVVTGTDKTAIFNSPFELRIYNTSGGIIGYQYAETSVTLGSDDETVSSKPTINTTNSSYAITGDCYSKDTTPIKGFKFTNYLTNNYNYIQYSSTGYSDDSELYLNKYDNLCKMNYFDGTITNTNDTAITSVVDIPIKDIASGYDILYDNSNSSGKVTIETIDNASRGDVIDVNGTPYKSLQTAIENAPNNSIININGNYNSANKVIVPEEKALTINYATGAKLNSYSKDALITNNGALSVTGDGTNNVIGATTYENNGNMKFNGSNNTNNVGYYFKQSSLVKNLGILTVDAVTSDKLDILADNNQEDVSGLLTINDGTFNSNTIFGKMTNIVINKGYFDTIEDNNYYETIPNVSGSDISYNTVHTKPLLNVKQNTTVTFNNFDVDNDSRYSNISLEQNIGTLNSSTLNLNNSKLGGKSSKSSIITDLKNTSTLNVNGGTYDRMFFYLGDNSNTYNQLSGTVNGSIVASSHGNNINIKSGKLLSSDDTAILLVDASGTTITAGTKGDAVSKTDPEVKGTSYGLASIGTTIGGNNLYFYDGVFKANSNPIDLHVEELEEGYDLVFKRKSTPKEKYLDILPTIYNYTTGYYYFDVQKAFDDAAEDDELIWLRDYTNMSDSPSLVVNQGKKFTLYLSYYYTEPSTTTYTAVSGNSNAYVLDGDSTVYYYPYDGSQEVPSGYEIDAPIIFINNQDIKDSETGEVITEVPFITNNGVLTLVAGAQGESLNTGDLKINTNFETLSGARIIINNGTLNAKKLTAVNIKTKDTMFKNNGVMNVYSGYFATLQGNVFDNYGTLTTTTADSNPSSSCYNPTKIKVLYSSELESAYNQLKSSGGDPSLLLSPTIINNTNATMNFNYSNINSDYTYKAIVNDGTLTMNLSNIEQYRDDAPTNTLSIDKSIINTGTMDASSSMLVSTKGIKNSGTFTIYGGYYNAIFDPAIENSGTLTTNGGTIQGAKIGIVDNGSNTLINGTSITTYGEALRATGYGTTNIKNGGLITYGKLISDYTINYSYVDSCSNNTATKVSGSAKINSPDTWKYQMNNGTVYAASNRTLIVGENATGPNISFDSSLTSLAHFCSYYNGYRECYSPYAHSGEDGSNYTVAAVELNNANLVMNGGNLGNVSSNAYTYSLYSKSSNVNFNGGSTGGYVYVNNQYENVTFGTKDGTNADGYTWVNKMGCSSNFKGINMYSGSYAFWMDNDKLCHFADIEDNYVVSSSGGTSPYGIRQASGGAIVNTTKSPSVSYPTFEEAIADASDGDTLLFIDAISKPKDDYDIDIDTDLTLNLNGRIQDFNLNIINGASITITDLPYISDNSNPKGRITNVTNTSGTLNIVEGKFENIENLSTLNLTGGEVSTINTSGTTTHTGGSVNSIINSGTLNENNGNVNTITNTGTLTCSNYSSSGQKIINSGSGALTLDNASIHEVSNRDNATITLNGAGSSITTFDNSSLTPMTFTEGTIYEFNNSGNQTNVTINGLSVTNKLQNYGTMTINSGNIKYAYNYGNGTTTINGGTFTSIYNGQNVSYTTNNSLTINNVTATNIYNYNGTLEILDGNIGYIYNKAVLTLGKDDGTISLTNPRVNNSNGDYAIYNVGTFNFYDGLLTGKNNLVINGNVSDIVSGYTVYTAPDYDEQSQLIGTYSMTLKPVAETDTKIACVNGICYNTLQEAINASVQNCDETNICPDVTIGDQFYFGIELDADLELAPQYSLTIDLNFHNMNTNGHIIPDNITLINGSVNGNNLQSSLAKFLSNVFGTNDNSKDIIITKMEDGNALDTTRTYKLYRLENGSYSPIKVDSDGAGKYSLGKETTDMKSIKGRIYINNVDAGEYMLKDNLDNELEFTIYDDGSLSPNIRENIISDYGHMSASAVATLIISIQTGIVRIRYILIGTIAVILILIGLLLYNRNKLTNKKETI